MGMLSAGQFLFISQARPLEALSPVRPHPSIFNVYFFGSLLGQFGVHLALLVRRGGGRGAWCVMRRVLWGRRRNPAGAVCVHLGLLVSRGQVGGRVRVQVQDRGRQPAGTVRRAREVAGEVDGVWR